MTFIPSFLKTSIKRTPQFSGIDLFLLLTNYRYIVLLYFKKFNLFYLTSIILRLTILEYLYT